MNKKMNNYFTLFFFLDKDGNLIVQLPPKNVNVRKKKKEKIIFFFTKKKYLQRFKLVINP